MEAWVALISCLWLSFLVRLMVFRARCRTCLCQGCSYQGLSDCNFSASFPWFLMLIHYTKSGILFRTSAYSSFDSELLLTY